MALPSGTTLWPVAALAGRLGTLAKQKKILGATPRRWLEYLVAILFGNAIYYKSLWPHLPESLQHQGFQTDMGSLVDLLVCVAVYGLIRLGASIYGSKSS
jgi:hypothetical protein